MSGVILFCGGEDAFFPKCTDRLGRKYHGYFLPIDDERLLLEIRLKNSLCSSQREADVMSVLLSFAGEFAS